MRRIYIVLSVVLIACLAQTSQARKLALLIGIDKYDNENVESLRCCGNDMIALKEALINIGFEEDDIQVLVSDDNDSDSPLTRTNIERRISQILSDAQPSDVVFLAFSGHGVQKEKKVYFCLPDFKINDIDGTCILINKVMDDLARCHAQFKLMIVDACRNDPTQSSQRFVGIGMKDTPSGVALFQSCSEDEMSWIDHSVGKSYFTKNFVYALSGFADTDHDGKLTFFEVCSWTSDQTKEQVMRDHHVNQTPVVTAMSTNFTLSVDANVLKGRALVEEARKAEKDNIYTLSIEKYNEAIALCPTNEAWIRERDLVRNVQQIKETYFNQKSIIVVPNNGPTIEEAYETVNDGETILITPGKYVLSKPLKIDRCVTIRGSSGQAKDVVIDCPSSHAFIITGGSPAFQNITVSSGAEKCGGFFVTGGTPKFIHCTITSRKGSGMYVKGEKANPLIKECLLVECGESGVYVDAYGRGYFSQCKIYKNAKAGIQVTNYANPHFDQCEVYYGNTSGVRVFQNGLGVFVSCKIYRNEISGFTVSESGNPLVIKCEIHDGKANGVNVFEKGLGLFNGCEIYNNELSGIQVATYGNPIVSNCQIHDGKMGGVYVLNNGMGTFKNNKLERNYYNRKLKHWDIAPEAGVVIGYGNTVPIPAR